MTIGFCLKQLMRAVGCTLVLASLVIYVDLFMYWLTAGNYMLWETCDILAAKAGYDPTFLMPAFVFIVQKIVTPVLGMTILSETHDV